MSKAGTGQAEDAQRAREQPSWMVWPYSSTNRFQKRYNQLLVDSQLDPWLQGSLSEPAGKWSFSHKWAAFHGHGWIGLWSEWKYRVNVSVHYLEGLLNSGCSALWLDTEGLERGWEPAFITSFQVMLMLLVGGHRLRATGKGPSHQFISFQSLRCVQLFATPCTAARQASLSITNT